MDCDFHFDDTLTSGGPTSIAIILKLIHVLTAFWFISGILGRGIALSRAKKASEVKTVDALMQTVDLFDKRMVIPGSFAVLVAGIVAALASNWPMLGFLEGGKVNWLFVSILLFVSNIPLIIFVYNPRGKIFGEALQDALAKGQVTAELSAAFRDRVVAVAHGYELVSIAVIVVLMVTKPF